MKHIFLSLLTIVCLNVFAQDAKDPKAEAILDKVSKKFGAAKSISSNFVYTLENQEAKLKVSQKGKLFVKGVKYRVELEQQHLISDGKTNWTWLKDMEEVQVTDADPKAMEFNPAEIFTIYQKNFSSIYRSEEVIKGKTVQVIDLTPRDKTKSYYLIRMAVNKTNSEPVEFKIFDKNGNRYTYTMETLVLNPSLADTMFLWNKSANPGVDVIDLR